MKEFFDRLPPWALNTSRVLAVLTLPMAVIAAVFVAAFVGTWGLDHDIFYMRTEATLIGIVPLIVAVIISLFIRWFGSRKVAFRLLCFSLAALVLFVGTAAALETINWLPVY